MDSIKESNFDICTQCNKRITSYSKTPCRKQLINEESSGNSKIDEFIKETQLNSKFCDDFIEWIPFSNLENIKYLTSGGNSKIYLGNWLFNKSLTLNPSLNVVLKVTSINDSDHDILKEFKMHHKCRNQNVIPFYGITKLLPENEYAMVIKHAEHGDLRNYIRKFFPKLTWTDRANILIKISKALNSIHQMKIFHGDFHCKNILVDKDNRILINDFGLCQYIDSVLAQNDIRGVLPYIAPEVLRRKSYTRQSEVYGIGMIMWELTSKKPPFSDWYHDFSLAFAILDGMRPKLIEGTPKFYADIMKQCWDFDPLKRPDASLLSKIFEEIMDSCKKFDNKLYSPELEFQPDVAKDSNEHTTESDISAYVTEAYKYSLGKLSLSESNNNDADDTFEFEEKKITKEFSIELSNRLRYYESISITNNSFDINSSSTIEDKIVKKFDDDKSRKMKHRKSTTEYDEKRVQLRKYQKASNLKKKNRRSYVLEDDDDEISSQVSESEDSRYATQTYDFSLDDLNNPNRNGLDSI